MKKIVIGTKGEGFDLDLLLATRLLIQANSGGGKSYAIRKIVEQLYGKVQVIIIDPEGEFSSLRDELDFILAGKDGETPADVRSAGMLATKLLELNVSAICDIYEMRTADRHLWVKLFLDSLINAPKNLWHPVVVVVDEAHIFAPEKGQGESVAFQAMADLATRGRKRGFCGIYATQRLGKMSKNVTAELQNVMIGSTFQDIDRKRASDTLGISKADERQFFNDIKLLEPGNFYVFGRAISTSIVQMKIGQVSTIHPKQGGVRMEPTQPSHRIKALLPKLADLPAQAEEKQKTEGELRKEITDLKKKMATMHEGKVEIKKVEVPAIDEKMMKRIEANLTEMKSLLEGISLINGALSGQNKTLVEALNSFKLKKDHNPAPIFRIGTSNDLPSEGKKIVIQARIQGPVGDSEKLPASERKILTVLAQYPGGRFKTQIAILTGYSHSGGGFNNAMSSLRSKYFIITNGDSSAITPNGISALGSYTPLPTGAALQQYWLGQLGKAEREILSALCQNGAMSKQQVAEITGYAVTGGGFNNALSKLRSLELINGKEELIPSENLFD